MGRRAVESVVFVFALLGFCCVPLGSKTGFEHTLALLETSTMREAGAGLLSMLDRARAAIVRWFERKPSETTPLPLPSGRSSDAVEPVPPDLPPRP